MTFDPLLRVLEARGIAPDPVIAVVSAVGLDDVFLGVGTLTDRIQLLVPTRPAALAVVAKDVVVPERSMLLVTARRDDPLGGGLVIGGATTLRAAVSEVAPPETSHLWLPIVEWLAAGKIKNRTRYLGEARGSITLSFGPDDRVVPAVTAAASKLKAPESWRRVYDEAGEGAEVGVTTECTSVGPRPRLSLRFGPASWDRAIDLAKALAGVERAREAAVRMGTLAAELGIDELRGVEAVVDAAEPDIVVWLKLRAA